MSLQPQAIPPIPEETARVARALFPKGNRYMQLRDELGTIYTDEQFAALYPVGGQFAEQPWRIALVLVMQYMENYTDRQAAEAMRTRIDWKYVLSLELTDPGFDFSVLSEFRQRLIAGGEEEVLLNTLLQLCRDRGWRKRARQATHRFDACARRHPHHESPGMCGRNAASRPQQFGRRGSGLAACPGSDGVV